MRLAAIYNLWDGDEHLLKSIKYILPYVEMVIIVYQTTSNFGEKYSPNLTPIEKLKSGKITYFHYNPDYTDDENSGFRNELAKRQMGLGIAKVSGATHFLLLDADEFYPDFEQLKKQYIRKGVHGSMVEIETYVAKENYKIYPPLGYRVPFIHKLAKSTLLGGYQYRCDRTRTVPNDVSVLLSYPMHHMSWVRKNLDRKLRNSSAKEFRDNELIKKEVDYLNNKGPQGFKSKYFHGRYIEEINC